MKKVVLILMLLLLLFVVPSYSSWFGLMPVYEFGSENNDCDCDSRILYNYLANMEIRIESLESQEKIIDGDGISIFTDEGVMMMGRNCIIRKDDGLRTYNVHKTGTIIFSTGEQK